MIRRKQLNPTLPRVFVAGIYPYRVGRVIYLMPNGHHYVMGWREIKRNRFDHHSFDGKHGYVKTHYFRLKTNPSRKQQVIDYGQRA
jgi:hypothetical protein